MIDFNGKQAAIRAGYAKKSANVQACRLLANDEISAEIQRRVRMVSGLYDLNADRVIKEIASIAFTNLSDVVEWDEEGRITIKSKAEMSPEALAALSEIESVTSQFGETTETKKSVKMRDKLAALDKLARILGLYKERVEAYVHHDYSGVPSENLRMARDLLTAGRN